MDHLTSARGSPGSCCEGFGLAQRDAKECVVTRTDPPRRLGETKDDELGPLAHLKTSS